MFAQTQGLKRPRAEEHDEELDLAYHHHKKRDRTRRPCFDTSLPFRISPTLQHSTIYSEHHPFAIPSVPPTLTPVESSDEDLDDDVLDPLPPNRSPHHTHVHAFESKSSASSTEPFRIIVRNSDDVEDMTMTDSQTLDPGHHSPLPWQRSRSNDMLAPPNLSILTHNNNTIPLTINPSGGRIATPIHTHFTSHHLDIPANNDNHTSSQQQHKQLTTTLLSPAIVEEPPSAIWWDRGRLPSPLEEEDHDAMMSPLCQADGMMGRLNVTTPGRAEFAPHRAPPRPNRGAAAMFERRAVEVAGVGNRSGPGSGRPGRLSMGFRADCEKCVNRVPGHYSHIMRD